MTLKGENDPVCGWQINNKDGINSWKRSSSAGLYVERGSDGME